MIIDRVYELAQIDCNRKFNIIIKNNKNDDDEIRLMLEIPIYAIPSTDLLEEIYRLLNDVKIKKDIMSLKSLIYAIQEVYKMNFPDEKESRQVFLKKVLDKI